MQPLGDVLQAESSIGRVCGFSPAKGGWQERDLTGVRDKGQVMEYPYRQGAVRDVTFAYCTVAVEPGIG